MGYTAAVDVTHIGDTIADSNPATTNVTILQSRCNQLSNCAGFVNDGTLKSSVAPTVSSFGTCTYTRTGCPLKDVNRKTCLSVRATATGPVVEMIDCALTGANMRWVYSSADLSLRPMSDPSTCLTYIGTSNKPDVTASACTTPRSTTQQLIWNGAELRFLDGATALCLNSVGNKVTLKKCNAADDAWAWACPVALAVARFAVQNVEEVSDSMPTATTTTYTPYSAHSGALLACMTISLALLVVGLIYAVPHLRQTQPEMDCQSIEV